MEFWLIVGLILVLVVVFLGCSLLCGQDGVVDVVVFDVQVYCDQLSEVDCDFVCGVFGEVEVECIRIEIL